MGRVDDLSRQSCTIIRGLCFIITFIHWLANSLAHISSQYLVLLTSQTLGLCIQPRLGAWSDRINSRVPFVIALSLIALMGIATLLSAIPLTRGLSYARGEDDDERDASIISPMAIAMAFFGFGAADICFDCLLIPGRALLDDVAVPAGGSGQANALFTGFQMCGRLSALLVGSSSWTTSGLWGLFKGMYYQVSGNSFFFLTDNLIEALFFCIQYLLRLYRCSS